MRAVSLQMADNSRLEVGQRRLTMRGGWGQDGGMAQDGHPPCVVSLHRAGACSISRDCSRLVQQCPGSGTSLFRHTLTSPRREGLSGLPEQWCYRPIDQSFLRANSLKCCLRSDVKGREGPGDQNSANPQFFGLISRRAWRPRKWGVGMFSGGTFSRVRERGQEATLFPTHLNSYIRQRKKWEIQPEPVCFCV